RADGQVDAGVPGQDDDRLSDRHDAEEARDAEHADDLPVGGEPRGQDLPDDEDEDRGGSGDDDGGGDDRADAGAGVVHRRARRRLGGRDAHFFSSLRAVRTDRARATMMMMPLRRSRQVVGTPRNDRMLVAISRMNTPAIAPMAVPR